MLEEFLFVRVSPSLYLEEEDHQISGNLSLEKGKDFNLHNKYPCLLYFSW